jgi:WD40 repeat protein
MGARSILIVGIIITGTYGVMAFRAQDFLAPAETVRNVLSSEIKPTASPKTKGLTMFRGNATRTFYGTGPIPQTPRVLWQFPEEKPLCGRSTVAGETKLWCGSGWTGQPVVWERPDGITEIIVGMYDKKIHFFDAATGTPTREPFITGDIIKGSVTLDPDGYPLLYSGSRDNFYRIIALDRETPTELWKVEAKISDGLWNNDWDGNGLIEDDILYQGSENGIFHIIKLNREYDEKGRVTVAPQDLASIKTFSDELLGNTGDKNVSIESSPLKIGSTVYIANSGGRIMGFDVARVQEGIVETVFDFWTGDDTDATLIADSEGFIYSASQEERFTE